MKEGRFGTMDTLDSGLLWHSALEATHFVDSCGEQGGNVKGKAAYPHWA